MLDMSVLGEAQDFSIRAFSVDDDTEDLAEATNLLSAHGIETSPSDSVKQFASAIHGATPRDILVSDIRIPGMSSLKDIGHENIDTKDGTTVGLQLLTSYYDVEEIQAGLRILLTQHTITKDVKDTLSRMRDGGDNIYAYRKSNERDIGRLHKRLEGFVADQRSEFIRQKFEYVIDLITEWGLQDFERNLLFGVYSSGDRYWEAARNGTSAKDVEARCDLIYRIKTNLVLIYGGKDLEQEQLWFRTKIPVLENRSPLEFLMDRQQATLFDLVMRMEGPW